jgi:hypothetical protein
VVVSPAGIRLEKDCAGEVQQQLKTIDPSSRQIWCIASRNPSLSKNYLKKERNWSRVPDERLTPRETGRLTADRNITLTLTLNASKI